jgi:hypothetical protein
VLNLSSIKPLTLYPSVPRYPRGNYCSTPDWDYVTSHDGERKRRQPYVTRLSREAFRELKRQHKGAALERAIAEWIAAHDV